MTGRARVLTGGGEVGALMRAMDWSRTPLGPMEGWPPPLWTSVRTMLASPYPIVLYWGPGFVMLYNDSMVPLLGAKHPATLGAPAQPALVEVWDVIGPMLQGVLQAGTPVHLENQPLFLSRQGFAEECYFTFAYSPIWDESDQAVGILTIASETTRQVLGERRFKLMCELSIRTTLAQDPRGVLLGVQEVLARSGPDVPFALLYRVEGERARLALRSGLEEGARLAPGELGLGEADAPWPLAEVLRSRQERLLEELDSRVGALHASPWPEPVRRALLLPLSLGDHSTPDAVLVVGLSPRLPLDEGYRDFLQLLARQLAADVARARALEQETQRAEQLAALDRVKTTFFSNVSHEFRTPLTLMLGPTENALASPERALSGEELERVHRNELRLLKLVNSLLDFSRLEAVKTKAHFEPVDLAALTAGLASAFAPVMTQAGLHLSVDCPPLPAPVPVDPDLWEKVVLNLLSNAFKYTLAGEVAVRLKWRGERVELSVRDTGTGIPLEEQGRLFERFHRVEGARGRSDEGSGIGLSLVRELVGLHGGEVAVESEPGQGSTFTVSVPATRVLEPGESARQGTGWSSTRTDTRAFVSEAEQWLLQTPRPSAEPVPPRLPQEALLGHVLLADDNADMRDYTARLLRSRFSVETVADGQAALEAARARLPDVVVSDVMMPRLDGFGLVRALKADARTAHVPIVLVSARTAEAAEVQGFEVGVDDYVVKPFGARELLTRVGAVLKTARARAESRRLLAQVEAARLRLSSLIQNAPASICVLSGPEHVFELVNPPYQRLVGVHRPLQGLPVQQALPEAVEQGFIGLLDTVYRTGEPFLGSEALFLVDRGMDGQRVETYVNFVYQPRRDARGQVEGIDVFGFEVTEQVRARQRVEALAQRLQESEGRQRRVVEASGAGLWELDAVTKDITGDARMVELMGLPPGTAFDLESGLQNVPEEDREHVVRAVASALAGEDGGRYYMVFRTGGRGQVPLRWVESRAQVLFNARGEPVSLAGAMQDITPRMEAEEARTVSDALLVRQSRHNALTARVGLVLSRSVALDELLPGCVQALVGFEEVVLARLWLLEASHDVLELRASAGLPVHLEEAGRRVPVGQSKLGFIIQRGEAYLTNAVAEEATVSDPAWARRERLVAFAGYPLRVGDKWVGVLELFVRQPMPQDTFKTLHLVADSIALGVERLRAEEALRTRVDFEQKLIGIASHDLRNPLSAILLGSSLVLKREDLDARTTKSLVRIQSAAERAARMVSDLLDFTQARFGGGLKIEPHPMDLHEVTRGVVEEVETAWPTRELEVRHEGRGEGDWDADRVAQVVQNLVTNALKYSPEDSPVRVFTRGEAETVLLSVANRGTPIPADKLESIFEPMQRATEEIDKTGRSVGLGLYIVQRIVEAHGGQVSVVSTQAEGTMFTVRLPRQVPGHGTGPAREPA